MANPEHIARLKEGVEAWNKWRAESPDIEIDLMDAHFEYADLTGAHLEHAKLRDAHFEHANLKEAHLEQAKLPGAHFEYADLAGAHLEHANLIFAHLEHANLPGAHLEHADLLDAHLEQADLLDAHLEHANLVFAHLENANLVSAHLHGANLSRVDLRDAEVTAVGYLYPLSLINLGYRKWIMRGHFQGIRGLDSCYGNRIFARDAADQDYIDTLHAQWDSPWGRFWFWVWGLTDYGRSFMSIIVFASVLMFVFGAAYSHWPQLTASAKDMDLNRFTPFYFSIVTYTTLGFGDVRPNSLAGEILVCVEVIFGYVTLGLLLAVLGNKIARRS